MSGLRKAALAACITGTLSFVWATWILVMQIEHAQGAVPMATVALSIVLTLVAALTPVFYFALFRNETPLAFGRGQRTVSLLAAVVFGILVAISLPDVLASFQTGLDMNLLVRLVGEGSNVAYLLLLIAIYHAPEMDPSPAAPSVLLEIASRLNVLLSGLGLVYLILQTGAMPYLFWSHRGEIQRSGQDPHVLQYMIDGPLTKLLTAACLFAAPYVVAMSVRSAHAPEHEW